MFCTARFHCYVELTVGNCFSGVAWENSVDEDAQLTQGIQELHALMCASLYVRYELLVLHCQPGYESRHINYQQLKLLLHLWTEEEVMNGESEIFFLTTLHDDLLESQLLPVLQRMGMDRRVPSVILYSVDMATGWAWACHPDEGGH